MKRVWMLPLEPIEERYTEQWYRWFPEVFKDKGYDVEVIDGEEYDHDLQGEFFLDPVGTNYYKASQIQRLMERVGDIEDGDEIFLYDVWFPGLEAIAYVRDMLDIDLKISGVLHAGTYDQFDLTNQKGMEPWGRHLEDSWFEILDQIYVGTQFHKSFVRSKRHVTADKLRVTGLPLDIEKLRSMRTDTVEDRIVFTGRLAREKGIKYVRSLQEEYPEIYVTMDHDLSKDEYYELLANSKAVFAPSNQETFGYGVLEGLALDCEPIVPNRLAFQNTVPKQYRYSHPYQVERRIESVLDGYIPPSEGLENYEKTLDYYHYENVILRMVL